MFARVSRRAQHQGAPLRSSLFLGALLLAALLAPYHASCELIRFYADLDTEGKDGTDAIGLTELLYDSDTQSLKVLVSYNALSSLPKVAHIHAATKDALDGTAGVAVPFPGFPTTAKIAAHGVYLHTFDLKQATVYSAAFLTANGGTADGACKALLDALNSQTAYVNVHTDNFGNGEIRGFPTFMAVDWGLYGNGAPLTITTRDHNAVYSDTLYAYDVVEKSIRWILGSSAQDPLINNGLPPGSGFTLPAARLDALVIFKTRAAFQSQTVKINYVLSSYYADNQIDGGAEHIRVRQLDACSFEVCWEDRLDFEPDRPEDPALAKDFNDFCFLVTGVYYSDFITLAETNLGLIPAPWLSVGQCPGAAPGFPPKHTNSYKAAAINADDRSSGAALSADGLVTATAVDSSVRSQAESRRRLITASKQR